MYKRIAALVFVALIAFGAFQTQAQEEVRDPVILIPGIGASINWDVFISSLATNKWSFTDSTYDNIISALESEGYILNENLFIAYYDWRIRNVDAVEEYLIPTINKALESSESGKVDIIAHSMGGLVARSYIQSDEYRNDVDQLVMLGTPNMGSADAYVLWEGGLVPDGWDANTKSLVQLYLTFLTLGTSADDNYDAVRNYIPSVGELMPIYPFLVDKETGNEIYDYYGNQFLSDLNRNTKDITVVNHLTVIAGIDQPTVEYIPVVEQLESEAKLWTDGKPEPLVPERDSTDGDGRVMLGSAEISKWSIVPPVLVKEGIFRKFLSWFIPTAHALDEDSIDDFLTNITIDSTHGGLMTDAIPEIFEALGLEAPTEVYTPPADPETLATLFFASPVQVKVTDPEGRSITRDSNTIPNAQYEGETDPNGVKMITIENPLDGEYVVELTGTADGHYHMVVSTFTDEGDESVVVEKDVAEGEKITYTTALNTEDASDPPQVSEPSIVPPGEGDEDEGETEQPSDPESSPREMIGALIDAVNEYREQGDITKKSVAKALVNDLKAADRALKEAEKTRTPGKKLPKLHEIKVRILEGVARLELRAFDFKVKTNERKGRIDESAAEDLLDQSETIIDKIKE